MKLFKKIRLGYLEDLDKDKDLSKAIDNNASLAEWVRDPFVSSRGFDPKIVRCASDPTAWKPVMPSGGIGYFYAEDGIGEIGVYINTAKPSRIGNQSSEHSEDIVYYNTKYDFVFSVDKEELSGLRPEESMINATLIEISSILSRGQKIDRGMPIIEFLEG